MPPKENIPSTFFIDPINSTTHYNFCFVNEIVKWHYEFTFYTSRFMYDETLVTPHKTKYFFFNISNFLSKLLGFPDRYRRILRAIEYPFNLIILLLIISQMRVKNIHFNYSIAPSIDRIFLSLCKKSKCNIILNAHNVLPHDTGLRYKNQFEKLYQVADIIITLTEYVKKSIQKNFNIEGSKFIVIPHGDLNYIFNQVVEEDGIFYENPTITFLGSINPYKGLKFLLEVTALILEKIKINLLDIGIARESMDKYYQYADQLGINNNIIWEIKYVPLGDMCNRIKNTKIFAFPYERTSQSGGIPAAFTLGKPVVIRSVGGLPEMIENNKDGIIANSPKEMAERLIELLKNNKKYAQMQKYIYSQRKNRNDWIHLIPDFLKVYNL